MFRKTFTDKLEAGKYANEVTDKEGIAVVGSLGDKFRVYAMTKEGFDEMLKWEINKDRGDAERWLRKIAWGEGEAVEDAIALKTAMTDGTLYSDYETAVDIARIMEKYRELKTAGDVFHFVDDTHHYDKAMRQFIDETLEEYDYEAKEEVAKE